jgi:predicted nucleotidyltransferase
MISNETLRDKTEIILQDVPDSFLLMEQTSRRLGHELLHIFEKVRGEEHGLAVAVFGSPGRYEMLPNSDVDVIIFHNRNVVDSIDKATRALQEIRNLPYDKIDTPTEINTPKDLYELSVVNSPDGRIADCNLLATSPLFDPDGFFSKAKESVNNNRARLENLLFSYHFLKFWNTAKQDPEGVNLKYSEGGSRDFIYFDWAADFLTKGHVTAESRTQEKPALLFALPVVIEYVGEDTAVKKIAEAIDIINACKHWALEISKQPDGHFDGILSNITAQKILSDFVRQAIHPKELMTVHSTARKQISRLKDAVYVKLKEDYLLPHESDFDDMRIVDSIWMKEVPHELRDRTYLNLLERKDWISVASVACQLDASAEILDTIFNMAVEKRGFEYIFRILIKHPNTGQATLRKMSELPALALDESIDIRYRHNLVQRLTE